MSTDPFPLFLGVEESADPLTLLGVESEQCELADIYLCLHRRMIQIQRHPRGADKAADVVRRRLRSAAKLVYSAARHRGEGAAGIPGDKAIDPFRKYLRVAAFADPIDLLGLPAGGFAVGVIDLALAERMKQIIAYPDSAGPAAEELRQCLRVAAALLKNAKARETLLAIRVAATGRPAPSPRVEGNGSASAAAFSRNAPRSAGDPPSPSRPVSPASNVPPRPPAPSSKPVGPSTPRALGPTATLTHFDRRVLGVMVACGGWNARSRSRLVALAERHQIAPDGLVKIVQGLSDFAKSRRARIDVQEIASEHSAPLEMSSREPAPAARPANLPHLPEADADEAEARQFFNTLTLSVVVAAITIMICSAFMVFFLPGWGGPGEVDPVVVIDEAAGNPEPAIEHDEPGPRPVTPGVRLATFFPAPTFVGNGFPKDAADAADECLTLPDEFDRLERLLSITNDPSESVFRDWEYFIDRLATGWVLADRSTRDAAQTGLITVIKSSSDVPSICDRLLGALTPPRRQLPEPVDLWRGAWRAGTLAKIVNLPNFSPAVANQARRQLEASLTRDLTRLGTEPIDVARAWLDQMAALMVVSIEFESRAYDFWESWLSAQRELGVDAGYDQSLIRVVDMIIRSGTDLARPGPSINVMGRMLASIDLSRGPGPRDAVLGLFESDEATSRNLWVLTSLLATDESSPWFIDELVLPEDADSLFRGRMQDLIGEAWVLHEAIDSRDANAAARAGVAPGLLATWRDLAARVHGDSMPAGTEATALRLLAAARINEAFDFLMQQRDKDARKVLDQVHATLAQETGDRGSQGPRLKPGQPIGPDGHWAARYNAASRNTDDRLDRLMELSAEAGTDLGPVDATLLVRQAYRGVPRDIRERAISVITHKFTNGIVVVMELLDQLPGAPRQTGLTRLITRVTGGVLPDIDADAWPVEARRLLLEHALRLHRTSGEDVELTVAQITESFRARHELFSFDLPLSIQASTPADACAHLVDSWRGRVEVLMVSSPTPGDLATLDRRRQTRLEMVAGPIQRFVAEQLSLLDLMAYFTVAEQPGRRQNVIDLLADSASRRARMVNVLGQALEVERAVTMLTKLRLDSPNNQSGDQG